MQRDFYTQLEIKKALNRRRIFMAVPIAMLVCALLSNLNEWSSVSSGCAQMKVQADQASSQLEEVKGDYEEALSLLQEKREYLAGCQERLAALPTPSPADIINDYDPDITIEQLKRSPETYIDRKLAFLGQVGYENTNPWGRIDEAYPSRIFYLWVNGSGNEIISVNYNDDDGRVIEGDVVIVYGTVAKDPMGDAVLNADRISFPTQEEIQDWAIDRAYGDSPEGDELRNALEQWQKGLENIS